MFKRILFTIILTTLLVFKTAKGQVYSVRALDGSNQKVRVADNGRSTLIITCLQDTIYINNWNNTIEAAILNTNFLKVVYDSRGGSGIHLQHTIVVCIDDRRLVEALHFTSLFHEEFIDFSKTADTTFKVAVYSTYQVNLSITGKAANDFKLNAEIHDERTSKLSQGDNYSRDKYAHLIFDPDQNVFYTTHLELAGHYSIIDHEVENEPDQYVKGKIAVAKFGKMTYYYIKGCWYERGDDDELVKYSYR